VLHRHGAGTGYFGTVGFDVGGSMDIEKMNEWLKSEGAKIKRIEDFVDDNFTDPDQKPMIKSELIDKAISPFHYFKKDEEDDKPFKRGDDY